MKLDRLMRLGCIGALAVQTAGCTIRPLPENVTRIDTFAIVHKVRCEARSAIMHVIYDYIRYTNFSPQLTEYLRNNLERIGDKKFDRLAKGGSFSHIDKYSNASIALDFKLRGNENNDLSGASSLARAFATGADVIGINLTTTRIRDDSRTFRIVDNWWDLIVNNRERCLRDFRNFGENHVYPITGSLNLLEIIDTFWRLNESTNLAVFKDTGESAFIDTLTFTTTVSGSFGPSFSIASPSQRAFLIKDASGTFGAGRTDEHQLIVSVYIPDSATSREKSKEIASKAIDVQQARGVLQGLERLTFPLSAVPR
ncbi:hypothetical protein [Enterovirga aerilata]|uniref:Uncharacterized protein n=1 Tax=Enterovirga aerilata TaxID=2730920 RepID=A0A849I4I8_9HYPH|nr:hypothetical protein [Enterovirga sp. DB1703]NNM74352.1 hypothetical protein [Enterovirga sp. DB1703]